MANIPPIFDVMKWMIQGMDTLPRLLLGVSPQHDSKLSHKSIHRQLKPARARAAVESFQKSLIVRELNFLIW